MSLRSEIVRVVNEVLAGSKKISELPLAGTIVGTELLEIVQNGQNVKTPVSSIGGGGGGSGNAIDISFIPGGDISSTNVQAAIIELDNEKLSKAANLSDVTNVTAARTNLGLGNVENVALSTWPGSANIITLGTITSGIWNGTRLTNAYTPQGNALSVWGVAGNATADQASISGTANQVLRVNGAGTSLGFGLVDLTQSVTGILPIANGGTGSATFPAWSLSTGGTLTGVNTITTSAPNQLNFTGNWTATANNQNNISFSTSLTARASIGDSLTAITFAPTLTAAAVSQTLHAIVINPTFVPGAFAPIQYLLRAQNGGTDRFSVQGTGAFNATMTNGSDFAFSTNGINLTQTGTNTNVAFTVNAAIAQIRLADGLGTFKGRLIYNGYVGLESLDNTLPIKIAMPVVSATSGSYLLLNIKDNGTAFNPSSGTATYTSVLINPLYNVTGGNPTAIGIDYNPSLISIIGAYHYAALFRSGLVGIGTGTPTAKLHVVGDGATTGELFKLIDNSTNIKMSILDNGMMTAASIVNGTNINYTWTANGTATANTQPITAFLFSPTLNVGGFSNVDRYYFRIANPAGSGDFYQILNTSHVWEGGGFNFQNGSSTSIVRNPNGTISIRGGAAASTKNITFEPVVAQITNNHILYDFISSLQSTGTGSLTRTWTAMRINTSFGIGTGSTLTYKQLEMTPSCTLTGSTLNMYGIDYNPTITAGTLNHYAALFRSGLVGIGLGATLPTAALDVAASVAANASFRIRSGVAPTTPNDGDIWFDNTNIYIRVSGTTKTFTIV